MARFYKLYRLEKSDFFSFGITKESQNVQMYQIGFNGLKEKSVICIYLQHLEKFQQNSRFLVNGLRHWSIYVDNLNSLWKMKEKSHIFKSCVLYCKKDGRKRLSGLNREKTPSKNAFMALLT